MTSTPSFGRVSIAKQLFALCVTVVLAGAVLTAFADDAQPAGWPLGLEPDFGIPPEHRVTPEKVALGRRLFFDPRLSRDGTVSCASCHDPERAFTDGRKVGEGIAGRLGRRNVPTVVNRLFGRTQFWDGRVDSLEEQALGPLFSDREMAMNETLLLRRLHHDASYPEMFERAFQEPVSVARVAGALAAYQRTLLSGASAFDRFEWEGDREALSPAAQRGLRLFRARAGCSTCHTGALLSDEAFHNLGIGWPSGARDPGRMAVTGADRDLGAYKTPSLRNVERTAPYMHDGSLKSLAEVIDFYDRGGNANPSLDSEIRPLRLTQAEKGELVAFLRSLTGPVVAVPAAVLEDILR